MKRERQDSSLFYVLQLCPDFQGYNGNLRVAFLVCRNLIGPLTADVENATIDLYSNRPSRQAEIAEENL